MKCFVILLFLLPLLVTALPSATWASSISLIMRVDSDHTSFNSAAQDASPTNTDSTRSYFQTGRLDAKGQINEFLSGQLRYRFDNVTNNTPNKTDFLSDQIDVALVNHHWSPEWMLTAGKIPSEILANDGIPLSEIYLASRARADIAGTYLYGTGFKLTHFFLNQEVKLMSFNQSEGSSTEQTKSHYGIVYRGSFLDKALFPSLSYHQDHRQSSVSSSHPTIEMIAAGLKYDAKLFYVSVDYLSNFRNHMSGMGSTAVAAADQTNRITSYLLDGGYFLDESWLLRFRSDWAYRRAEDNSAGVTTDSKYEGLSLAAEYRPFQQNTFRYHLAWTQLTEKPDQGSDRITQHLIFGLFLFLDFLK